MIYKDFDIRPLAAAVIVQASKEAQAGDQGARQWLQNDGLIFLDACGVTLEPAQVKRWIQKGCKSLGRGGLRLGA